MNNEKQIINKLEKLLKEIEPPKRPFGMFISGGIDSALLAELLKPDIVFTCRFPYGPKYDEFEYTMATVRHLKLKCQVVVPTKKLFHKYLPEALKMFKKTKHFSLVPLYLLFQQAKANGITTIVSGEGPDEYLGGYASYSFITNEQKMYDQPELQNYKSALDSYLGSPMERFAKIIKVDPSKLKPYWGKYKNLLSKMGYADLKLRGIEEMELALAKGFGIKLLYPYMSKKIEKFCFEEVPDSMKIKGFITKWIERKIAEKYLPKKVVWRKNKMGGPVAPVGLWLGEQDEFTKDKYLKLQDAIINYNNGIRQSTHNKSTRQRDNERQRSSKRNNSSK